MAADSARLAKHNFECSGCGASMSYDADASGLRCPFCGSVDMVQKDDAKVLSPNRVVPFELSREEADASMRQWLGRSFWRPGDLSKMASVEEMTSVYVPYWVFQADTHTYWTADTNQTPAGARGDWYPMCGEHRGKYSALLIGASGALTPRETSEICPFELSKGKPPEEVDLERVTVEQFSMPRKYARPLARQGLQTAEAEACDGAYVPGRSRNVHVNVRIESMSSEPMLLPVWIMAYRYRDRLFRFLVNGQNGRSTGQAPVSWPKIIAAGAIAAAVILVVLLLIASMLGCGSGQGVASLSEPAVQTVDQRMPANQGPNHEKEQLHAAPSRVLHPGGVHLLLDQRRHIQAASPDQEGTGQRPAIC